MCNGHTECESCAEPETLKSCLADRALARAGLGPDLQCDPGAIRSRALSRSLGGPRAADVSMARAILGEQLDDDERDTLKGNLARDLEGRSDPEHGTHRGRNEGM